MGLFDNWKFQWPFSRVQNITVPGVALITEPVKQITETKAPDPEPEVVDFTETRETYIASESLPMPMGSGERSSVPDYINTFAPSNQLQEIPPDFAIEWLPTLTNLAAFNPDFSYAVDNIIQLANTEHEIEFSDKVKATDKKKMLAYIKENEGGWYQYSGGLRSLKADLLAQVVINGALSAENVPNEKLNGIKQVVRVAVKDIRFVYDPKTDTIKPYQQAPLTAGQRRSVNGLVELNPATYHYIALRRFGQGPYPVPPLITAVEGLIIQKKQNLNLSKIMDKLGMLGFLAANVTRPEPKKGESDEDYYARLNSYLDNVIYPQLAKNLGQGVVAGFKDSHEFKLEGNNMNVSGAEGLVKLVQLMVFSGLKQDPNMLGHNYSTTETFGRVILTKMISQVRDYQTVVDSYFEQLYLLALRLAGFSPGFVKVTSKTALVSDQVKDAEAKGKEIDNAIKKREANIIDDITLANELGYEKPAGKFQSKNTGTGEGSEKKGKKDDATTGTDGDENTDEVQNQNELIGHLQVKYGIAAPVFPYEHVCGAGLKVTRENFATYTDFEDPKLNGYSKKYFDSINKQYKNAIEKVTEKMKPLMAGYNQTTSIDTIQRDMYMTWLQFWEPYFTSKIGDDIKLSTEKIYNHYRKDKSIFDGAKSLASPEKGVSLFDVPPPIFNLEDFRAMEFMENNDQLYLGKFITDQDTKERFYRFLYEEYIDGGMPIGKGQQDINAWFKGFSNELNLEAWKIRRIIDTSVVKVRNFANLSYIHQAQVQKYEVIEIEDKLTCDYCMHMAGRVFNVNAGVSHINKEVQAGPGGVGINPFATALKLGEFKALDTAQLEAQGFLMPPFHPHCRGRLVAKF